MTIFHNTGSALDVLIEFQACIDTEVRLKFVTAAADYLHFSFSTGLLSYALNSYVIESNEQPYIPKSF